MPENRAEAVKSERRRKPGDMVHLGIKLGVNEALLDRDKYAYRWINDKGGRLEQMTKQDDWDLVDDPDKAAKPDADGLGSKVAKVVGGDGAAPMRAYLARKPKAFYDEDAGEKRQRLDKQMESIRRGIPQQAAETEALGANAYVPGGQSGISIKE